MVTLMPRKSRQPAGIRQPIRTTHSHRPQGRTAGAEPALVDAVTPVAVYRLWTQKQAAAYLNVSERYLRDSSCPKVLLPGNGKRGERLVRYKPSAVIEWADNWSTDRRASNNERAA